MIRENNALKHHKILILICNGRITLAKIWQTFAKLRDAVITYFYIKRKITSKA